jgi:hypothetical protein
MIYIMALGFRITYTTLCFLRQTTPASAAPRRPFFASLFSLITVAIPSKSTLYLLSTRFAAFGESAVVGATAAVLWAPASGAETRTQLAKGLGRWWQTIMGRENSWRHRLPGASKFRPVASGACNLAMQPNRLLTED